MASPGSFKNLIPESVQTLILDALPEICCFLDPDLRIRWANKALYRHKGKMTEAVRGAFCYQLWSETGEACEGCPSIRALETGKREETYIDHGPGGYWKLIAIPLMEGGLISGVIEFAYDQTESRSRELALQEQKLKYQMLYEKSPNPYQSLNEEGCFVDVNPAWLSTLNYTKEEVIGKWFGVFLLDNYRDSFRSNFAEFKRRGSVKNVQFEMKKGDGTSIRVAFDGCIGYGLNKGELRTYCVFKDISKEHEAQKAMQEAMARARELNLKKSMFMANVSHELRTPLNGILGFASLLAARTGDETSTEYTKHILESGEKLLDIIEELLTLSDLQKKKTARTHRNFDLANMVKSLISVYESDPGSSSLSFLVEIDSRLENLQGDSEALSQILNQLISNASKFSNSGLILCRAALEDDCMELLIRDEGIGIPESELEKVFERFYQCEQHTTREHGGMGIGLSIVREEVEDLGGSIRIESRIAEGTEIHVRIPLGKNLRLKEERKIHHISSDTAQTRRVLIAEDEGINRLFLSVLLRKAGYSVIEAVNGEEAVTRAAEHLPDLILMDLSMPVMDGIEAAHRIVNSGSTSSIPIVAVTAYDNDEYRTRCSEAGMKGFIAKPVDSEKLLKLLNTLTVK